MTRRRTELLGVIDEPLPGFESARLRYADSRHAHSEIEGDEGESATRFENRGREIRLDLTHAPVAGLRGARGRLDGGDPLPRMSPARFGLGARWTQGRPRTSFVKDSVPMPGRSLVAGIRTRF